MSKTLNFNGINVQLDRRDNGIYSIRWTCPRTHNRRRESTKQMTESGAINYAREFFHKYVPGDETRVTVGDLMEALLESYRDEQPRNYVEAKRAWDLRMRAIFENVKSTDVRSADVRAYKAYARGERAESPLFRGLKVQSPVAKGTVNRDLAILCRAYSLGIEDDRISYKPKFKKYSTADAVRTGFLEQAEFDVIMALTWLPLWLRALVVVAYTVGNRANELRNLKVRQLDFLNRLIVLEVGTTKNKEGRIAPMTEQMYQLLLACCTGKQPDDYVFTRSDRRMPERQVGRFDKLWKTVLRQAGINDGILLHDMRRSAVKNMTERGVDRDVAKAISGHKTDSVFTRYNIVNSQRVLAALEKIEAGAEAERQAAGPKSAQNEAEASEQIYKLQ